MKKLAGFVVKAGLVLGFVFGINLLRGRQAEAFHDEALAKTVIACAGDAACVDVVNTHFESCYDANHSSRRKGRYGREHMLDQPGFDACIALARGIARIEQQVELESLSEGESEELAALREQALADGVIDEYEEQLLAEAMLDAPDGEAIAAEAAFESEPTALRGEEIGGF